MIPAINGMFRETGGEFAMPGKYATGGLFPTADGVFDRRMRQIGDYEMTKAGSLVIQVETVAEMAGEAYELTIEKDRVMIHAHDERGYNYALVTLFQLLALGKGRCRTCEIKDAPKVEMRGTMLDVCRHFFPVEEVKKIIEQCALLKMNHFHWHLSEDQGFRIES